MTSALPHALTRLMPPVQTAPVNGIEMAYYEAGPKDGPAIVLCHGFPETAFSWRHQISALAAAGYRVIAPDQRGYGLTKGPDAVADYDMEHLTGDLVALLDHLGLEKAVFCGHDWGGFVVWQMPLMHRERCAGVIGLNTPYLPRYPAEPISLFRQIYGPDMYIVWFQTPEAPDQALAADVAKTMRFFMRKPAALRETSEKKTGGSSFAFAEALAAYDPAADTNQFLSADEMAVFVALFEHSGFTGGINWYRNFTRNWERGADLPTRIDDLPCLMIMAEKDAVLPPSMADKMGDHISDLEKVLVTDSGHWTQQEQPQAVNGYILDWMRRRFPA
ncbi:alpha/beta fold hydrolase [Phenylobacterium sp.]|uniref:alpha/beta fold hydrolase n=1 Tax=Phenylobacterium sp. TaxID=1871053 RepID=UPI00273041B7|nr:alpha/beta hydrolase [Phenylobacterium sp.]MDP2212745.1 alpha/beta hydrolase [Phenylobacterium sp.]